MLDDLVQLSASGVLEVAGNPSGAIYLDGGEITFAQASWVPDLADRLSEVGGSAAQVRALLAEGAGSGLDAGALLMQNGSLSKAALKAVLRSVVIDALIVLTMPLADETSVTATRFQPDATHWARGYCRLKANSMRAVAQKRSSALARGSLAVNSRLELRDLIAPTVVLSSEHWAIASRIDGSRSIRDLAAECGIPLYDAIDRVCYLTRKGMCAARDQGASPIPSGPPAADLLSELALASASSVPTPAEPGPGENEPADAPAAADTAAAVRSEPALARRKPRHEARHEPLARRVPAPAGATSGVMAEAMRLTGPTPAPTTDQLRRVLEGLRRLT